VFINFPPSNSSGNQGIGKQYARFKEGAKAEDYGSKLPF